MLRRYCCQPTRKRMRDSNKYDQNKGQRNIEIFLKKKQKQQTPTKLTKRFCVPQQLVFQAKPVLLNSSI